MMHLSAFETRSVQSSAVSQEYSQWDDDDEDARDVGRESRGRSRDASHAQRRMEGERLSRVYSKSRSRDASVGRRSDFEAEDEAIEITRAELESLRERIDQARSEAGYSSASLSRAGSRGSSRHGSRHGSRHSSRHSFRHSSRQSLVDASDSASEFGEGDGEVGAGLGMIGGLLGVDTSTSVWTPDELDDPVIKGATGAHAGSAIVPQKVIDKYEKAKNDYEAALKAKKDKKAAQRRALDGDETPRASAVHDLAAQFNHAINGTERKVRKQMDYKTQYANKKAARMSHARPPESNTLFGSLHAMMFGCCMGRGK